LQLQITWAASFTNIDNGYLQLESLELPEATPARFLKATTLTKTPAATGDTDIELPIGNKILGILLWGTTVQSGATATKTINSVKLLLDNTEQLYSKTNQESLRGMQHIFHQRPDLYTAHVHVENTAANYAQNADTVQAEPRDGQGANYLWLPFDVTGDGAFALETQGLASAILRINAGDTNAIRAIPLEIIEGTK
jgi:hypothetical protein